MAQFEYQVSEDWMRRVIALLLNLQTLFESEAIGETPLTLHALAEIKNLTAQH